MANVTRIVLVGLRGTGKTTVGQCLARSLNWSFTDSDDLVESTAGKSIAAIFAENGEPRFRDLEADSISEMLHQDCLVLATGGGAVIRPETRDRLKTQAHVVWLTGDAERLAQRLSADVTTATRRPALTSLIGAAELESLLRSREPHYRDVAHLIIDTTNRTPDDIAAEIERKLTAKGTQE
ncbi:MAG: shikimate kinase [Gemmataceae bacterium]